MSSHGYSRMWMIVGLLSMAARPVAAATISVPAGGNLQTAINSAHAGDTILLTPGVTYTGNFTLPVHDGTDYITIRTAGDDTWFPPSGTRMTPSYERYLAKIASPNNTAALRTKKGAAYWRLLLLEIAPSANPIGTQLDLGDGSDAQARAEDVPHHLIVDRLYIHGDPAAGQKRAIGLNSGETTIVNSYISDIKGIGQDTQAIAGANGPGPYRIENNYLESAGTAILFGGDDPRIPGLTPSDIVFRGNVVTRPVAWRDAILATPANARASASAGGTLAAGAYAYRVVARRAVGSTTARSAATAEVPITVAGGALVTVQWNAVPDATEYLVYGRTPGAATRYWRVTTTSFVDDGTAAGTAGTPSSSGTVWQVKNLFELKNARHVQADYNTFQNNWAEAQSGAAILFTPRNQYGSCTWCTVEDVTFEYNVVQGIAGGIQILGTDNLHPSGQTNGIRVRNNVFSDLSKAWGGNAYFLYLVGGSHDVAIDHNTIVSPNGSGVVMADGGPTDGLVFTNNLARHNLYGIFGSGQSVGTGAIAAYLPDATIDRNVLAGGKASSYPAGNAFPTVEDFQAHFVDYAGGDFALVPGTDWERSGTDGLDLGADIARIRAAREVTDAEPPQITTETLPETTEGTPYDAILTAAGGLIPYTWALIDGVLPNGLHLDTHGILQGLAARQGDYPLTVQVRDAAGAAAAQPLSLRVNKAIDPVRIVTGALDRATATVPYAQVLQAIGGLGSYAWTLVSGALPPGMALSSDGALAGTPLQAGTYHFVLSAVDSASAARRDAAAFAFVVTPPPNRPPTVLLQVPDSETPVPVGAPVTFTAQAADEDGIVSRVDFYVDDLPVGSATGPAFTASWTATPGRHQVVAVAVDNANASTTSAPIAVTTQSEIVLRASDATVLVGNYQLVADATAAGGQAMWNPDLGAAKVIAAAAHPASYVEFTFYAEAGRPYHFWLRGKGERNNWSNDSAFIQFSDVDQARIGTTGSITFSLEEAINAGVSNWGWEDNGYGSPDLLGANVVFTTTGRHTLRVQPREDGLTFDQIVLSPDAFLTTRPGPAKNDSRILAR